MTRRKISVAGVVGLLACALASTASAAVKTVDVGGPGFSAAPQNLQTLAFQRGAVSVHAGDSVRFRIRGGLIHAATFVPLGQSISSALDPTKPLGGLSDANGMRFWFNGKTRSVANPIAAFPVAAGTVTGSALSGIPRNQAKGMTFRVTFTKTGTFKFVCVVHRGMHGTAIHRGMHGTAIVLPRAAQIASRASHAAAVKRGNSPIPHPTMSTMQGMKPGMRGMEPAVPADARRPSAPVLPRKGWTATASDQETARLSGVAANVLDGHPNTIWHSQDSPTARPLPHWITIDMHRAQVVSALVYQPRGNGRIGAYSITLSSNGRTWGAPVAVGTMANDATIKTLSFAPQATRFVRLTATSKPGNSGPRSSIGEINLLGDPRTRTSVASPRVGSIPFRRTGSVAAPDAAVVDLPRADWTASASDQDTATNAVASNVLDGNTASMWISRRNPPPPLPMPHWIQIDMHTTQLISALVYTPRQAAGSGRIGAYTVTTSVDGTTFGPPVASGTWPDTTATQTATFTAPTSARYVRLTATTQAGNHDQLSSAAEIHLLGTQGSPAAIGSWGPVIGFPVVPVASALLPNNKLLVWSSYKPTDWKGGGGLTQTAILDLATGVVTQRTVSNTGHDMFCPGIAVLADGRVMVTGGNNASKTSIYDPVTDTWSSGANMNIPRGYQAMTPLSNGDVFVLGGSWSGGQGGKNGEIWSHATGTWRLLPGVPVTPALTADPKGIFRQDNHMWFYATSNGRVLQMGPSKNMNWIDTTGSGTISPAGPRADSADAMNGDAIAYDVNKILTLGGATAYDHANATNRAYTIDLTSGQPVVTRTGDMAFARSFANSVVLPNGQVVVVGGQAYPAPFSDSTSVMTPELWDPNTGAFTPLASMPVPRNYHSVANLLPDGRVFSGGGGLCGTCATNHTDGAILTPPYLLNADGSLKPRPAITVAPANAANGSNISVSTDQPVSSFVLVRTGEATHSVDNDQRRVPLSIVGSSGTSYTLAIPADPGVALPGNYMLFAMDANGVPSIAKIVNVSQSPPQAQPPGIATLAANAGNGAVSLSWTAPASDGGAAITGYKIYRGTASGGETLLTSVGNVTSFNDTTAVNGTTYYYEIAAVNSVGDGALSSEVTATPAAAGPPPPSTGLLDSFTGAPGPLSISWQSPALSDPGTVSIASSGVTAGSTAASSATWSATTFTANQESYLTVPVLPRSGDFLQVIGRLNKLGTTGASCYLLRVTPSTSTWDVRKKINGATSTSIRTFNAPFAAGDSMALQLVGSTLNVFRRPAGGSWSLVGSATDTAITGAGYLAFTLGDTTTRGGSFGGGGL